ncbi:MAG TPA: Jag N-terminal domain-containing protein [Exilispira sp.]|nr:Jag N-terminal domain-containing protein [Exilispira sp.]
MDKLKEALRSIDFGVDSKKIEVVAETLEKAISEACKRLRATIDEIDYEILEYGSKGMAGFVKKNYKILAYKRPIAKTINVEEEVEKAQEIYEDEITESKDGYFAIIKSRNGVLLKVTPAAKGGRQVKLKEVLDGFRSKGIENYKI